MPRRQRHESSPITMLPSMRGSARRQDAARRASGARVGSVHVASGRRARGVLPTRWERTPVGRRASTKRALRMRIRRLPGGPTLPRADGRAAPAAAAPPVRPMRHPRRHRRYSASSLTEHATSVAARESRLDGGRGATDVRPSHTRRQLGSWIAVPPCPCDSPAPASPDGVTAGSQLRRYGMNDSPIADWRSAASGSRAETEHDLDGVPAASARLTRSDTALHAPRPVHARHTRAFDFRLRSHLRSDQQMPCKTQPKASISRSRVSLECRCRFCLTRSAGRRAPLRSMEGARRSQRALHPGDARWSADLTDVPGSLRRRISQRNYSECSVKKA